MFKKTVLDSGITVVTEAHKHQKSVSVGVFVCSGTRDEKKSEMGASHFVEHMVFKGTKNRSAYEISRCLEAVGGDLNAYTTREYTCFHATSLKKDLKLDIEVLGDLVTNALFRQKDFDKERSVILQEVAMTEDTPEEYIFDVFFEKLYPGQSMGWPILGSEASLKNMKRRDLINFYKSHFVGSNIIVAAAGALEHDEVIENVKKYIKVKKGRKIASKRRHAKFNPIKDVLVKQSEQTHVLVGFDGLGFADDSRYDAFVLNAWLGGGMSSKLYQSIREKKGLAYTVYSQMMTLTDGGLLTIYAGTEAQSVDRVLNSIFDDVKKVKSQKITKSHLDLFKNQVAGGILLGSDDMENRMNSLGVNEMTFGDYIPIEKVVDGINTVTANEIGEIAEKLLDYKKMAVLVMGKVNPRQVKKIIENQRGF
ncbi:MAG: insulinase family protein [Oligoflexia bacterium]|nr:insulinase family protein [Oligoflexia bacterium]